MITAVTPTFVAKRLWTWSNNRSWEPKFSCKCDFKVSASWHSSRYHDLRTRRRRLRRLVRLSEGGNSCLAKVSNIFTHSETGSWRRKRINTIRSSVPMSARAKANVGSSNPPTLVPYATSNKSWILQIFPRILCKTFKNPIAIISRVFSPSMLKSRNSTVSDFNLIRSFLIRQSIQASIRYWESKAEVSSPIFRTQTSHIACPQDRVISGIRRIQQKQVLLLFICTQSISREAVFSQCIWRVGFPDAIMEEWSWTNWLRMKVSWCWTKSRSSYVSVRDWRQRCRYWTS